MNDDEEEQNWEEELERLSRRLHEPVNLNTATRKTLEQFPFLNDIQIENLLAYIYLHGQMQTIYELSLIAGMDKYTIDLLLPFIHVQPVADKQRFPSPRTLLKYGKQEMLTRLDIPLYRREGYRKKYLGTPMYHSLKYKYHYGEYLQVGFTAEKDAGEPLFALHNRKGYDYYSFHLLLRNLGRLRTLALGDYRLSFGQGLVIGTGIRPGKSYSLATVDRHGNDIRGHTATDEYNFFRGAAATVKVTPNLCASLFYSYRPMDGVVEEGIITSIRKTGLHRSQAEAEQRNAFARQTMGGNIQYDKGELHIGATGIYYAFNRAYEPKRPDYARFNLHGNHFYNVGADYRYRLNRFTLAGEVAVGKHGYAALNKLTYTLRRNYRLLLIHRYYAHNYWAMLARPFGEGSTPQNENGWYVAAEVAPLAQWRLFASLDLFSFPWWRYRISKPSQGIDGMFGTQYTPKPDIVMTVNYRYKRKERDVTGTGGKEILPTHHHRLRYQCTWSPPHLQLRTTIDYNHFHSHGKPARQGVQCTESASYTFRFPLKLSIQGTWFHTDDYDSRVYASERGVLYNLYTPSYSGRGFRFSCVAGYNLNKRWMLLAKIGETLYRDRNTIGSGNDLIHHNRKADIQLQLQAKF
ncbi:MAG: helix-hairpin-helix domain-containing protein [Prevotellaceae bacterium]|nr:helix-hairpin-helix domain-containing protein [Prevotellaceae bacterium]